MNIIFATGNAHKLEEAKLILKETNLKFQTLKELGFNDDIVEDGPTLEANALIKARHIYNIYQRNVFSEDTGLEIVALNNEPGVYTARYAGPQKNHDDNMNLVLEKLKNATDRAAKFRAVIALIYNEKEYLFEGAINGQIALKKSGKKGFGYDPIFIPEGYKKTFAELGDTVKSQLSHRAIAMHKLKRHIQRLEVKI